MSDRLNAFGGAIASGLKCVGLITLSLLPLLTSSCKRSQSDFAFLDEGGDQSPIETIIGNSAIEFSPASYDFGPIPSYTGSSGAVIAIENRSAESILISSFSGATTHFTLISDNCPKAPNKFSPNQSCQLAIQFAPKAPGTQLMTLSATYKITASGGADLTRTMTIVGQGVSPLNFDGVQSVSNITHKSMQLNWNALADAKFFIVFIVDIAGNMNYLKTFANDGGTVTSAVVTGLSPSSNYKWRVRAVDALGNQEGNVVDVSGSTSVNNPPNLSSVANPSVFTGAVTGNIDINNTVTGTDLDIDGDIISYTCLYDNIINGSMSGGAQSCSSLTNQTSGAASFNTATGIISNWEPLHSLANTPIEFEIIGTDPYGATSAVYFSATIQPGIPLSPSVTGLNVVSPVNNNSPIVYGSSQANFTIKLYANSSCTGSMIGGGIAGAGGSFAITASVANNSITTIYATATNFIGNESPCSGSSVTVIEDSNPPAPLMVTGTSPPSPSANLNPSIVGITEAIASIEIFSDSGCTSSVATGSADLSGNFAIPVTVLVETTTQYWAKAVDTAGNATSCSATSATYLASPLDPSGLLLWADGADGDTLFKGSSCSGALATAVGVDVIGCWADKSGLSNHLTQGTGANQPLLGTRGLRFNGTSHILTNGALAFDANSNLSYFLAVGLSNQSNNSGSCCRPILSWVASSANFYPWIGMTREGLTPSNNLIFGWTGSPLSAVAITSGDETIISAFHNGSVKTWNTYHNGTQNVSDYTIPASYTTTTAFSIGGDISSAARRYMGQILEVIVYSGILNTTNKNNIEGFLACKWDLRHQLPVAHPFYNANGAETSGCP